MTKTAYLALGSNLGDRWAMLRGAVRLLNGPRLRVRRCSPVYETAAMYRTQQPAFLNCVIEAETDLFPRQFLSHIQHVERALARHRLVRNGPRTIDVDLLFYGSAVVTMPPLLTVPHPRLHERRFVLAPLCDLAPDLRHPMLGKTMRELLAAVKGQDATVVGALG